MRKTLLILLLLLTKLSMTAKEKENTDPILANLRQLYVKVTPIWNHYIVFQGNMYSVCNSKGIPIIPFIKEEITPGLPNYFILNRTRVMDTMGNELFRTSNRIEEVSYTTNTYKSIIVTDYYSILNYKGEDVSPSGSSGLYKPFTIEHYKQGMVAYYEATNRTPRKLIGVKDTLERIVIPAIYNDVSIGQQYISGTKGDTVYLYDKTGKLLWAKKGDRCMVMKNDRIGIRLYGLWALVSPDGKLLTPYSYGKLEYVNHPYVIRADNKLIDKTGKIVLDGGYSAPEPKDGRWWQLGGYDGNIYDDQFNLIIKAGTFRSATFAGKRFITLSNNYGYDENSKTYDRIQRKLVNLQVEETIKDDVYIVTNTEDRKSKLLINNKIQELPEFTSIKRTESKYPLYIIKFGVKTKNRNEEINNYYNETGTSVTLSAQNYRVGLLDCNFKLILPMKFIGIRYIDKTNIIHANGYDGNYLYTPKGKLIAKARANSTVRSKEWIVEMSNSDSMIIADSTGLLYIGKNNTSVLGVREIKQFNNENIIPTLLAKTDDKGYDGIYTLAGKQLYPHTYHIVSNKMSGITTLKKDDSLYFISHTGKMLYGGRGFSGRNCTILDSYAMLLSNKEGKYGVLDAVGVTITPFIFDSFFTSYQTKETVLVKEGQYAAIANTGYLKYPLQPSYPPTLTHDNSAGTADGHYYQITAGGYKDLGTTLPSHIEQAVYNPNNEDFIRWYTYRGQGQKSGIYNRYGKRIAYIHNNFTNYTHNNLMLVADSAKEKISMIDTSGHEVIPYIKQPKLLIANYLSIISINKNAIDTLYRIDGKTTKKDAIFIDSATKQKILEEHKSYIFSNSKTVKFSATGLKVGIAFARGTTLWDTTIDSAIEMNYVFAVHKKTGWGIYHPIDGWIEPATCDSITNNKGIITTYKNGKKGCYNNNSNSYLPPVYTEIYSSVNREVNFHVVKENNKFMIINKDLQPISATYDSIYTDYSMSPNLKAFDSGKVIQLQLAEDGMVRPSEQQARKNDYKNPYEHIAIVKEGNKMGIYNNSTSSWVQEPVFDTITRHNDGFWAWKDGTDGNTGKDETWVLNVDGVTIHQFKGKISPVMIEDRLWANMIHGNPCSPIITDEGKEIVPAGYEDIEFYKNVIVAKKTDDDKLSIYTRKGKKTTKATYDEVDETESGLFIATATDKDGEDVYTLISPQGKILTKAPYSDIKEVSMENTVKVLYKAQKKDMWGVLDANGKEISPFIYQQDIKVCSNNTLIVKNKEWKYGVVSMKGKTLIPFEYDYLNEHTDTTYSFKKGEKQGILNMNGIEAKGE